MKNKILVFSFIVIMIFTITACGKQEPNNEDAIKFKEEYESLNEVSRNNKVYRSISIDENNPFIYITAEELLKKIDNEETFYVYFGSKFCPWCRSVIEKAIEVAKKKGVSKIYYIDIWDDEGNEILRDKYIIDSNNELKQSINGTDDYYEILNRFDSILSDYTLVDKNGNKIDVGEKRIFAPNFVYVKNGNAEVLVDGISDKQENSNEELTNEILEDETEIFSGFFEEDCGC
ncbi:MAG: hypothetical protein IJY25_02420 [Bacilli bacterium]|nr:hypothetical protein [Bacilli bacterium]